MHDGPPLDRPGPRFAVKGSPIHGRGVFATALIPRGMRLLEYAGERISKAESLRRCEAGNEYIFQLDEEFDLDGHVAWNPSHWINHSCSPNCEAEPDGRGVFVVALRDIQAGEELTFNYGYDLIDYQEYPCRCGAPNCVGYIVAEAFFPTVRRNRRRAPEVEA